MRIKHPRNTGVANSEGIERVDIAALQQRGMANGTERQQLKQVKP
jgi:hypothetical protein